VLTEHSADWLLLPLHAACGCSSLPLDGFWVDEALDAAAFQSQVVPDAIELDLEGVAASLEQHFHPVQQQYNCLADLAGLSHLQQQQQPQQLPQQQLSPQQQVPDMLWVATQAPQVQDPAVAALAATFKWPCPQELKAPLKTPSITIAPGMVPQATPAVASPAPATPAARVRSHTSCDSSQPGAVPALWPTAFDDVATDTAVSSVALGEASAAAAAPAAAPEARPMRTIRLKGMFAGANSSSPARQLQQLQQQLGPAARTRAEAVARYKAKRARRSSVKRVRYQRRKEYADQRPRVGGRFIKKCDLQQ
jgi:hypothetical protein